MQPKRFESFLGINNRLPDFELDTGGGRFLRSAENVDINNKGKVLRRRGRELVQAMTGAHSWHETGDGSGFIVRDGVLYSASALPFYTEHLKKILTSNAPMSYVDFNGITFFSNGTDSGKIVEGSVYPWGMSSPDRPILSLVPGALPKGKYLVALTFVNSVTGEESGAAGSSSIETSGSDSIRLTLPVSAPGATHVNVYLSQTNGSMPYLHSTYLLGDGTIYLSYVSSGRQIKTSFDEPLPAGTGLFIYKGRLCCKKDRILYYGLPWRLGYYDPSEGYIQFEHDISVAVPCQEGVYVASNVTRWIYGDLSNVQGPIPIVLPYGAVPDTQFSTDNDTKVGWFGEKGIVMADSQGQAVSVMAENVDVDCPSSGFAHFSSDRGFSKVVSCGYCMNTLNHAVTTYENFGFTSISGRYGTMPDGFYMVYGDSDNGADIDASVSLGKENFDTDSKKRVPYAYIGVNTTEKMQLRVVTDQHDYTYSAKNSGGSIGIQRIDPGLGIESTWFDLTISNQYGADFTISSATFEIAESKRRI